MRYDKKQIDQWIKEWEKSGLSICNYCTDKPFDKSTFYNWRKKSTGSSESKKNSNLVQMKVTPSYIPHISIHYPNGVRLDLHMLLSSEDVRALAGC